MLAVVVVLSLTAPHPAPAQEDEFEGMPPGPGREKVYYLCGACHSIKIVQQQRLSRERWDKLLVWMVEEQGMPELEANERSLLIDYLGEHYGQDRSAPAANLPQGLEGPPQQPLTPRPRAGDL